MVKLGFRVNKNGCKGHQVSNLRWSHLSNYMSWSVENFILLSQSAQFIEYAALLMGSPVIIKS